MIHLLLVALLLPPVLARDDAWPTHRHDPARSGVSSVALAPPLELVWTWRSGVPPRPAWPGPAKRDAYNKVENLKGRLAFDRAFEPIAAEGRVWFGSSADDQVHCLDARSGRELWSFFAEAPVRFAPTYSKGKLWFGADDGYVYCLDAKRGEQLWKVLGGPKDHRVPGNGRMMSLWPVRSGVVVDDGVAYFFAGLFPAEGAYLRAVDAKSGRELWQRRYEDLAPQGYLLASPTRLYMPTSRGAPAVYRRTDGERVPGPGGVGGTFALLAGDSVVFGPGKTGQLGEFRAEQADQIATFAGTRMIVDGDVAYLQTDFELSRLERTRYLELVEERREVEARRTARTEELANATTQRARVIQRELEEIARSLPELAEQSRSCLGWRRASENPLALILAGDALIAGGDGSVTAFATTDGAELWRLEVEGRAYGLAASEGRLFVSTDRGEIRAYEGR